MRTGWIEGAFTWFGPRAIPRPSLPLLTPGLTEGCGPDERLPGLGPPIRMRIMGVVYVKIIQHLSLKVVDRTKVPALEKTAGQHPKPPCHLIEPRPVFWRKMQHRLLRPIAPERPPRHAALPGLRDAGESTPGRHQAAKVQAP